MILFLTGLHYRGRANLDAVLDHLFQRQGMDKASEVVFTGGSAGGLAVYLNVDHVATRVNASEPVNHLNHTSYHADVRFMGFKMAPTIVI